MLLFQLALDTETFLCYTTLMKTESNFKLNCIEYSIKYYFVFCSRYRRKIFDVPGLQQRLIELIKLYCVEKHLLLYHIEFYSDTVVLDISSVPTLSPSDIMNGIKKGTSKIIRDEFGLSSMNSLWTRDFMVSTEPIPRESIDLYVSLQKKRL